MKKMKLKILSITMLGLFIGVASCGNESKEKGIKQLTQNEVVKQNIEISIKELLHDTSSYEFVKLILVDSILYSDNIEYRKEGFSDDLNDELENLKRLERYKIELPSMYDENEVNEIKEKIQKNQKIIKGIDSLEMILGKKTKDVASYTYHYSFRGNNSFGVKVLQNYIVQTNGKPEFSVINMTDNQDEVYLNPNDFPGYKELILNNMDY